MATEVKVPGVGESVQEGMIESWHKSNGELVVRDEILLELETDKATVEIAAEASGVLHILKEAGELVRVGDIIATIDESATTEETTTKQKQPSQEQGTADSKSGQEAIGENTRLNPGPAVRKILSEHPFDTSAIHGTGKGGRLTKSDVLQHIKPQTENPLPIKSSQTPLPQETQQEAVSHAKALSSGRAETRKPMSMIRRKIAERLLEAQQSSAILTTFNEVDMTEVMELRRRHKDSFQEKYGIKLGFMGLFLKASVHALEAVPAVNAYIDGTDILYHNYCDIGVAVSTNKGLLVPVIRDVDKLTIAETEQAIAAFAEKARNNKISIDDLSGGTFTVSNGGVFGSLLSTPILNPPQSAILGMHKTQMRPVVMPDGSIQARPMMYLAVSYDHRIIDGKEAVTFLVKIKETLEDPARLLLGV